MQLPLVCSPLLSVLDYSILVDRDDLAITASLAPFLAILTLFCLVLPLHIAQALDLWRITDGL